ncbi:riboflavin synthase-like [Chenopodium quinoa]|uniref:riboflavin synthase-like n=1 Tax=Chenopodium quinoa TaxID=63459 RepID=UPI000B790B72|nr:riboflavin synthase-like [Chenopodium quinoa]
MAITTSLLLLISPKLSQQQNHTFCTLNNPSNRHIKFNPNLKSSVSKLFNTTQKPQFLRFRYVRNQINSMFTGIVEELGHVKHMGYDEDGGFHLQVEGNIVLQDVNLGDSIAVNGTCLTVTEFDTNASEFTLGLAPETLRKTTLMDLEPGSIVNLERALLPSTRMGGHFVQGHVDGTGEIVSLDQEGDSLWVKIKTSPEILRYIVPKGFIAIDGTSLTVVDVLDKEACFNIMLVAYTQQNVVIPLKKVGQKVNLEVDILGKYVERLLSSGFLDPTKS